MFENFTPFDIVTQSNPPVTIHGIKSPPTTPPLPPLLLLHGFPQTHHIFHLITPHLLTSYTLILIDIRGYGASTSPPSKNGTQYAKSLMARDCHLIMSSLGHTSYFICAHDRGARVAHKLMIDYPLEVKKAILLDICPTKVMYENTSLEFAKAYWHWFFLIQKEPLPEIMIRGKENELLKLFMGGRFADISVFDEGVMREYMQAMRDEETVHSMCEDYRAGAGVDIDEQREDEKEGRKIQSPVLVLWGRYGVIEKMFNAVEEWKKVSDGEVRGESLDCGHYIPEEKPIDLVGHIKNFLKG